MAIDPQEWLGLMEREYFADFIEHGGAAVKFVVADEAVLKEIETGLRAQAALRGMLYAGVNSAEVKFQMIQDVFFAIARQVNWAKDAQSFVEHLFVKNQYHWPHPGERVAIAEIAEANKVDATILRREFNKWLSTELMDDHTMAQDFRIAICQLCLNVTMPAAPLDEGTAPVLQWLRGELRLISALKSAYIFTKITRYNARSMLRSLCHWLTLAGHGGLVLVMDIRQVMRTAANAGSGLKFTTTAVLDAYEVLRQLIDDADLFERLFVAALADSAFIEGDPKRSIDAYRALKLRVWNDVQARDRANPLSPLVTLQIPQPGGFAQ